MVRSAMLPLLAGCFGDSGAELTASSVSGGPASPGPQLARSADFAFPIQDCEATYGRTHHDYPASDIFANEGCPIVSVTAGVVDEVSREDRWSPTENDGATRGGLSVSIIGDDGARYYYSHFSVINRDIAPGERVESGQRLGQVGTTGSARGTSPHLHFGLSWPTPHHAWWTRRGMVAPAPYLDAWRDGRDRSPAKEINAVRKKRGDLPPCDAAC